MSVDGAGVLDPEVGEEILWRDDILHARLEAVHEVVGGASEDGDLVHEALDEAERLLVARVRAEPCEVVGKAAHRRRVGATVVIDDDHEPQIRLGSNVVEGLPSHAARERAVTDDGHDGALLTTQGKALGHAFGPGQRRRGV